MAYSSKISIKPFSPLYVGYYNKCLSNNFNCAEGAYRSGKSTINVFSFANHLEYCSDKIHLASGETVSKARGVILEGDGLGLKYIFRGRSKVGKFEGNDAITIRTKTGEKVVVFAGGSLSNSYMKIQGLSFGSWICTEAANAYISDDDKCFIDMAISRLIQSKDPKIWWDLNPSYPTHKIYTKYIDKYKEQYENNTLPGGYNFIKCTLYDNSSLTEEQRQNYISKYPDVNSMEHQRYILGNRACAEGLIFRNFARDKSHWIVEDIEEFCKGISKQFISIGVDFGGNGSDTAFVATLVYNNFKGVIPICSDKIIMKGGQSDVDEFKTRLQEFIEEVGHMGIAPILYIWGDNADPVMMSEIKNVKKKMQLGNMRVLGCKKHTIKQRIDLKKLMMARGIWHVYSKAESVISSTETQVWDGREGHDDERLDNGSVDIDTADAEEYSWSGFLEKLIKNCE